ncbi:MAG: hypothetical protein K2X11_14425 [Acetobacteraceae bacterium]|nr:hypothetical protein [Acetobacteraceae bacterium]
MTERALAAGREALTANDPVAAEGHFRAVLAAVPGQLTALHGLGKALHDQARFGEAIAAFEAAAATGQDAARGRYHAGLLRLLRGEFAEGWAGWEERAAVIGFPRLGSPLWDGQPLPGGRLLILAEQGFGDVIQFLRFLPEAAARSAARVTFGCAPELTPLVQPVCAAQGIECVTGRIATEGYAAAAWIGSLPRLLGVAPDGFAPRIPYLEAPAAAAAAWRRRRPSTLRCLGVVWEGRADHPQDHQRSLPPALLAPLTARPGTLLVGLQRPPVRRAPPAAVAMDWGPDMREFSAAAAMLAGLDGLVTVDTAMAHLAGALGLPAVVLLPFVPDWRWGLGTERTPWYPTLRLARQAAPGDWDSAIQAALRLLAT